MSMTNWSPSVICDANWRAARYRSDSAFSSSTTATTATTTTTTTSTTTTGFFFFFFLIPVRPVILITRPRLLLAVRYCFGAPECLSVCPCVRPLIQIIVKNSNRSLTPVVRAQNNTSITANITDTIFNRKKVLVLSTKPPKCSCFTSLNFCSLCP